MNRALATALLLAFVTAGCSTTETPVGPTVVAPAVLSDTFTGTLVSQSANAHNFFVILTGEIAVTLTAAGPATDASLGIGLGIPSGFGCTLSLGSGSFATVQPASAAQITGTVLPGTFCVSVFDPDPLTVEDPVDYSITVAHS